MTSHYPDRCFAFDQFGPLSIRPCHGACWAPRKHPARLRATYHRTHGIRYFHGCYGIGDDQLWGVTREHKGGGYTLAALKSIRAARPGGYRLFVIMDNLAANKTPAIRRWTRRENVELCFTPTNASWANPIEAQFGPVRTFVNSHRFASRCARQHLQRTGWLAADAGGAFEAVAVDVIGEVADESGVLHAEGGGGELGVQVGDELGDPGLPA